MRRIGSMVLAAVWLATAPPAVAQWAAVRGGEQGSPTVARAPWLGDPPTGGVRKATNSTPPPTTTDSAEGAMRGLVDAARLAPPDVSMMLCIRDAAAVRAALAEAPIGEWIGSVLGDGQLGEAWQRLARNAEVPEPVLFQTLLDREVVVFVRAQRHGRAGAAGCRAPQWAVSARVDDQRLTDLLRRMKTIVRPPTDLGEHAAGVALTELPDHDLLVARLGERVVIGPGSDRGMLVDVLACLCGEGETLAEHAAAAMQGAASLPTGQVAMYLRHRPPMGGRSLAAATLDGSTLHISHAASFDAPPFTRRITRIACDLRPLRAVEADAIIAVLEPTDLGPTLLEQFLDDVYGVRLLPPSLHPRLGKRRMLVLSERDPRQAPGDPVDALSLTPAVCVELDADATAVQPEVDQHLKAMSDRIFEAAGAARAELPDFQAAAGGELRHVELPDTTERLAGGWPILRDASLNWVVTDGEGGTWCVIASCRDQALALAGALDAPGPRGPRGDGTEALLEAQPPEASQRIDSCGMINGVRLARQLASWSDEADHLAPHDDPAAAADLARTLRSLSQIADGVQRLRWTLHRPTRTSARIEIEVTLREHESAGR